VVEIHQRAPDSRVSPSGVLKGHPHNEALDLFPDSRAPELPLRAPDVFLRDQIAIPAKQRVGRDDGRDASESARTKALRFSRQSTSLRVRKPKALSTDLLPENAVLLLQVFDDLLLVPTQPTGKQNKSELQRQRCHRETLARPGRAKFDRNRRSRRLLNLLKIQTKFVG
jgi:hypothetical protein